MAQNNVHAPSSRILMGVAHAGVVNEKFTVAQNIWLAPSSRVIKLIMDSFEVSLT